MPSTAVANRLAAARKIKAKYKGFRKDAHRSAARQARQVAEERARQARKGASAKAKK